VKGPDPAAVAPAPPDGGASAPEEEDPTAVLAVSGSCGGHAGCSGALSPGESGPGHSAAADDGPAIDMGDGAPERTALLASASASVVSVAGGPVITPDVGDGTSERLSLPSSASAPVRWDSGEGALERRQRRGHLGRAKLRCRRCSLASSAKFSAVKLWSVEEEVAEVMGEGGDGGGAGDGGGGDGGDGGGAIVFVNF